MRVKKPPADNTPSSQNYFQTNCQSVIPMFLKQHWDNLFEGNFAEWDIFCTLG